MFFSKILKKIFRFNQKDKNNINNVEPNKPQQYEESHNNAPSTNSKNKKTSYTEAKNKKLNVKTNKKYIKNKGKNETIYETNTDDSKEISFDTEIDEKITFKNIEVTEIKTSGKSKFNYNNKELFVEEVALEYYKNKGYAGLFTENHYWWYIYALLFWDIIFMKTDTCTQVPMNHPDFDTLYQFTVDINGMPMDFFKETFYKSRKKSIEKRLNELLTINLNNEIETTYNKHYGKNCRPIEDWSKYSLNQLLLASENTTNKQIVTIMKRLIENFSANRRGLPDLTLFKNNKIFFAEVKSKKDTLSTEQIQWHEYLVKNADIPVIIFSVNKTDRQINNFYKKYSPELIEKKIPTNNTTNNKPEQKYSFVPDGLIEVKYKEFSNTSKSLKAMDKYMDIVLDYENQAQKLEKTNPNQAIAIYEKLVYEYKFGGNFPHDRLLVLYRKQEKYKEMIEVCDAAIANLGHNEYLIGKKLMVDDKTLDSSDKKIEKFKETKNKIQTLLKNKPLEDKIKIAKNLEKENIDEAIKTYEEVIKEKYPKKIPYNRLCILYRKKKNYEKELETCDKAIEILNNKDSNWFIERKIKVQEKKNKQ